MDFVSMLITILSAQWRFVLCVTAILNFLSLDKAFCHVEHCNCTLPICTMYITLEWIVNKFVGPMKMKFSCDIAGYSERL